MVTRIHHYDYEARKELDLAQSLGYEPIGYVVNLWILWETGWTKQTPATL